MLKAVISNWQEARGTQLRKEVEDTILKLSALSDSVNIQAQHHLLLTHQAVVENYGPLEGLSSKAKKKAAKQLLSHARKAFDLDMGRGYALFLASAYIEAQGLPGEDARHTSHVLEILMNNIVTS